MLYNVERPHTFDAVIGQEEIVKNIRNQSLQEKFFQVYILGGQFGSGKTTMARIIALAVNCEHKDEHGNPCCQCESCRAILAGNAMDVVEMDAASNTGVDNIRELKDTVSFLPATLKKKVYIIDEVHMLSNGAFNALLKVLEEPPEHVMFILCTTEIKKIPSTVRSRAAMYNFGQIAEENMFEHLCNVAKRHDIAYDDAGLHLICKNSEGAMRNALSILEQVSAFGKVTEEAVASMLGISDPKYLFELAQALISADRTKAIASINTLMDAGKDPFLMISDLLDMCADSVLATYGASELINGTQAYHELIASLADGVSADVFSSLADGLMDIRAQIRQMPGKTTVICGIIRMLSEKGGAVSLLSAQIKGLQKEIADLKSGVVQIASNNVETVSMDTVKSTEDDVELTEDDTELIENSAEPTEDDAEHIENSVEPTEDNAESIEGDVEVDNATQTENISDETDESEDDTFSMFSMFSSYMFNKEEETVSESSQDIVDSEDMQKTDVDIQQQDQQMESASEAAADGFETLSDDEIPKVFQENEEEESVSESVSADSNIDEVHRFIDNLCSTEPNGPFLQNVLSVPCTEVIEDGRVIFVTKQAPVYKILEQYEEAMGPFPFKYRFER